MTPCTELVAHIHRAVERPGLQRVLVFGSYARGDQDEYSDLDIVVVCETDRPFLERFRDFKALFDLPIPVELLVYTPAEFASMVKAGNPFISHVLNEAVEL